MAVEQFANQPTATVTSGGATAPASGTSETWVSSSWAAFAAVSSTATPPTQMHIYDTASGKSSETVLVTNISGTSATVVRGAEGTTPVAHSAPFIVTQAITPGGLAQLRVTDWLSVVTVFGADPTGTADSTAVLNSAFSVAAAAGLPLYFPAGTYKISAVLNAKYAGLRVIGAGSSLVTVSQATANTPILQVAGQGQRVSGLTLAWTSQQASANTSAIAMEFGDDTAGSCFESIFEDIYIKLCNTGLAVNPSIASVAGLFSCDFRNIHIIGYSYRAISLTGGNGVGAGATGCVFTNTYIHNNFTGSDANSTSWPVYLSVWSEVVFNELNIEHAQIQDSDACVFASCGNVIINGLHLEHLEVSGNPGYGLVGVGTGTGTVQVNGLSVRFCTFTGTSCSSVLRVTGGSNQNIILNGLTFPSGDGGDSAPSLALMDFNSATGVSAQVTGINGTASQLYTVNEINAGAGSQLVITDGAQVTYAPALAWTTFATGGMGNGLNDSSGSATVPAAGTWYYADLFIPFTTTVTGFIVEAPAGPNSGTDKWIAAAWPGAGGAALANSATAGLTVPGSGTTAENFKIAFTAPVTLAGPAVYKAAIQSSGVTAKIGCFSNPVEGFVTGSQAGTFGTVPSLTPGSSYSQNLGPMLKTY